MGVEGEYKEKVWIVDYGIDLSDYYPSVEWDILAVPGKRHERRFVFNLTKPESMALFLFTQKICLFVCIGTNSEQTRKNQKIGASRGILNMRFCLRCPRGGVICRRKYGGNGDKRRKEE